MRRNALHPMLAHRRAATAFSPRLCDLEDRPLTGGILTGAMLGPFLPWLAAPQDGPVGSPGSEDGAGSPGPQASSVVRSVTPLQDLHIVHRPTAIVESASASASGTSATRPGADDAGAGLMPSLQPGTKPTKDAPRAAPPQAQKGTGTAGAMSRRPAAPLMKAKFGPTTTGKPTSAPTPPSPASGVAILPPAGNSGTSVAAAPSAGRGAFVAAQKANATAPSASPVTKPAVPRVGSPPPATPNSDTPQTLTWTSYGEGTTSGNTVNMSFPRGEFDQQPIDFHGASTLLAPGTTY
jgi:hypothetical protein